MNTLMGVKGRDFVLLGGDSAFLAAAAAAAAAAARGEREEWLRKNLFPILHLNHQHNNKPTRFLHG